MDLATPHPTNNEKNNSRRKKERADCCSSIFIVCVLLRNYTNNSLYIYRLRNTLFIHATCFDPHVSSSGVYSYTWPVIELQCNIRTSTLTNIDHNRSLSFFFYTFWGCDNSLNQHSVRVWNSRLSCLKFLMIFLSHLSPFQILFHFMSSHHPMQCSIGI
jgi:hypothetical protein